MSIDIKDLQDFLAIVLICGAISKMVTNFVKRLITQAKNEVLKDIEDKNELKRDRDNISKIIKDIVSEELNKIKKEG